MKKIYASLLFTLFFLNSYAQFGTFKKKEDLEKFKDSKLIVVMFNDSAYNASVAAAMEKYWSFTAFDFAADDEMAKYRKGNYTFLIFSKAKGSKNKSKLGSSEDDLNGLAIINKFSKRATKENLLAYAFCNNKIDTQDWETEMIRGVQLLNNYFNYAVQVEKDRDLSESSMMANYPSDKSNLFDKKLLIENKQIQLKGKEEPMDVYGGEVEAEVEDVEIQTAIKNQDNSIMYFYYAKDEKSCNKLFVSAANSELMYFVTSAPDKCKCELKDLKALKDMRENLSKKNSKNKD